MDNKRKPKLPCYWKAILLILAGTAALNILSFFEGYCDFYAAHIFPVWINTYARVTGLFPFSLGEFMIVLGILLVLLAVVSGILFIFLHRRAAYRKYAGIYYRIFAGVLTFVLLVMTLNCNLLYGCTPLSVNGNKDKEYTAAELEALRNYLVEACNGLSADMERTEDGAVIYEGDIQAEVKKAMWKLSETYERLSGYYPDAKPVLGSVFMSQAYNSGVYFPFSMEANYNDLMYILNYPAVISHEFAHLKGYIYEDEANFLAYLACIGSDDAFIRYSGYLSVLGYVERSYKDSVSPERYRQQPKIDAQVYKDDVFLAEEAWKKVEASSPLDTEKFDEVTDVLADNSMKFYGVSDGIASYDRVTDLLLQYYDGILYTEDD